ncbi:MAG: S41 family peptidase [Puia sp.]|nr:S41 family peptidase [Puia sp.]
MKLKALAALVLLVGFSGVSNAQDTLAWRQAYETAQEARRDARKIYNTPNASPADVEQSIRILHQAITFLDSPRVRELAQGNFYLKARSCDVYRDLITANIIAHDREQALEAFEKMADQGRYFSIPSFETDSVYAPIRSDPRYAAVVERLKLRQALWTDEALNTPTQPDLTTAEKVAGLSLLWSQAKYNFANFDHANIDWDKVYLDYLPLVTGTGSTIDYYRILQKFYAQLKDSHSNVYFPQSLAAQVNARPPMRTALIEGKVYITDVFSDSLRGTGIVPGLQVMAIDGQPVLDYARQNVQPYQSSSTSQDLEVRTFTYFLLAGPKEKPIALELTNSAGKTWQQNVARQGYLDRVASEAISFRKIGQTGWLIINNFEDQHILKTYDSLFPQINQTRALIIDIRKNGGGSDYIGFHILSTLTNRPFKTSAYRIPRYTSIPVKGMEWMDYDAEKVQPDDKMYYDKPVALLISTQTFSAAEDFAVAFDYMKRGKMVGQTTGGSTGQPISFTLPGGGMARICGKHDRYPDGKEFVGIGIHPDVPVDLTVADLLNHKDKTLQTAVDLLKD